MQVRKNTSGQATARGCAKCTRGSQRKSKEDHRLKRDDVERMLFVLGSARGHERVHAPHVSRCAVVPVHFALIRVEENFLDDSDPLILER